MRHDVFQNLWPSDGGLFFLGKEGAPVPVVNSVLEPPLASFVSRCNWDWSESTDCWEALLLVVVFELIMLWALGKRSTVSESAILPPSSGVPCLYATLVASSSDTLACDVPYVISSLLFAILIANSTLSILNIEAVGKLKGWIYRPQGTVMRGLFLAHLSDKCVWARLRMWQVVVDMSGIHEMNPQENFGVLGIFSNSPCFPNI